MHQAKGPGKAPLDACGKLQAEQPQVEPLDQEDEDEGDEEGHAFPGRRSGPENQAHGPDGAPLHHPI